MINSLKNKKNYILKIIFFKLFYGIDAILNYELPLIS